MRWIVMAAAAAGLVAGQTPPLAFEAATIKPSAGGGTSSSWHSRPGYIVMKNMNVRGLISTAYRVETDHVTGGPKWIESDRFDIEAKAEGPANDDALRVMLKALLEERFHLKLHPESKIESDYALVVAKGGMKIQPDPQGGGSSSNSNSGKMMVKGITMTRFAASLTRILRMQVIDATEQSGQFSFDLEWAPEQARRPEGGTDPAPPEDLAPSIFTAVQNRLGLKLESRKVPVDLFVIDHLEKPGEN